MIAHAVDDCRRTVGYCCHRWLLMIVVKSMMSDTANDHRLLMESWMWGSSGIIDWLNSVIYPSLGVKFSCAGHYRQLLQHCCLTLSVIYTVKDCCHRRLLLSPLMMVDESGLVRLDFAYFSHIGINQRKIVINLWFRLHPVASGCIQPY